jgi:O-antigen ligase
LVFGLKLLLPILLLWGLLYLPLRAALRGVVDVGQFKKLYIAILVCTIPNFIAIKPELFFVFVGLALWIVQLQLGGDVRAKITTFWMSVILFVPLHLQIGGIGGINYLLSLDHFRLAAIILLIPALFTLPKRRVPRSPATVLLDVAVMAYPLLVIALTAPSVTLTGSARSLVATALDVVLPYFVLTSGLQSWEDFKYLLVRLCAACLFAAVVGLLEFAVQRNIYSDLQWAFGVKWSLTHTLLRGNLIRVQAMTPQPILFAAQLMMTLGLWWAIGRAQLGTKGLARLVDLAIVGALVFTFSRGPWLGALAFALTFFALSRVRTSFVAIGLVVVAVAIVAIKIAGLDASILAALKTVFGDSREEAGSIEYRNQLLNTAIALVQQSPWFGVPNYAAQMQDLVQGEGIIDLVNAYVGVALNSGLVGLALFLAPFALSLGILLRRIAASSSRYSLEQMRYLRVVAALLVAFLLTIFTTSSWERLPFLMLFLIATPAISTFESVQAASRAASHRGLGGPFEAPAIR